MKILLIPQSDQSFKSFSFGWLGNFSINFALTCKLLQILDKSRKSSSEESSNEIKLKGKQPTMHQRSKPESKTSSIKSPKTSRKGPQKSKLRNYNKRDDDG